MAALEEQLLKNIPYPLKQLPRNAYTVCMRPDEGEERGVEIKTDEELRSAYTQVQESRESGVGKLRLVLEDTNMLDDYLVQRRYVCVHTYLLTYVRTYIHTYIHTYLVLEDTNMLDDYLAQRRYVCVHTHVHACIHTYIYTHIHAHILTYKHTHTHMHAYTHTCRHTTCMPK
jgi:hypothetical protein